MNARVEPDPRLRAGLDLLQGGRGDEALTVLLAAEAAGVRDASLVLGQAFLHGEPLTPDPARAVLHLERAAAQPWGPPEALLAAILGIGHGVAADPARAWHWFGRALVAGHLPALRTTGILRATAGDARGARHWLERAAGAGDRFAGHALGLLAAATGDPIAARRAFAAAGLPISARRAQAVADIAWPMTGAEWTPAAGRPPWADAVPRGSVQRLCDSPVVEQQDAGLSPWECDHLLTIGAPNLRPSRTLDPRDGGVVADPARTSSDASLRSLFPDLVVHGAALAFAELAGLPLARSESLAMLRYGVGQEYRPHLDAFAVETLGSPRFQEQGQRVTTVIGYLDRVPEGGTTRFPKLDLAVEPRAGRLLRFDNMLADGQPDPRALHCGDPVVRGDKWIVTAWFRERPSREYRFGQIPGGS